MIKEFSPALIFLGKFVLIYFLSNIIYGVYIESFENNPDPITYYTTYQSASLLNTLGSDVDCVRNPLAPTVLIQSDRRTILNVFEGCNGVNVCIVFIAFVIAYGGTVKRILLYCLIGVVVIHFANLVRLSTLYYTAQNYPSVFYYFHKYLFTAILYVVVFVLWAAWVLRFNPRSSAR